MGLDARVKGLDARVKGLDARVKGLDALCEGTGCSVRRDWMPCAKGLDALDLKP